MVGKAVSKDNEGSTSGSIGQSEMLLNQYKKGIADYVVQSVGSWDGRM